MTSSAAKTAFCAEKIEGPGGLHLWIDGNQKITAGNGTYEDPSPNAFSLVQIEDCPGATSVCKKSCYVHGLEKHSNETHRLYRHNSETIRKILSEGPYTDIDWANRLAAWIEENCAGGFRWHVSGDVFSAEYAEWIADVCRASHGVQHWIYTRSFEYVPLLDAENLTVNLSADAENYYAAVDCALEHALRICYFTHDGTLPWLLAQGDVIFPDYSLRGRDLEDPTDHAWWQGLTPEERKMVCPVDFFGKSPSIRCGPCRKCF